MHFLSNLITTISNANAAKLNNISCKFSTRNEFNYIRQILIILQKEGIIRHFTYTKNPTRIIIYLKYNELGNNVIKSIFIVSKPSRPIYIKSKTFWQPQISSGFFIISTKYGIITDAKARQYNLGGHILFGIT